MSFAALSRPEESPRSLRLGWTQIGVGIRRPPQHRCPCRDVLCHRRRFDLVEGVVGAVVEVEIMRPALREIDDRRVGLARCLDIGAAERRQR
jgi:hypothetical protein